MPATDSVNILVARVLAGRAFLVKTNVCIQYYLKLKRWLLMGIQGAVIYGRPRLGKTSATRWVLSSIQRAFGKVPYIEVPIRKQHLHNEGAFFQFLLKCCRNKHYNKGTVADKRDRFLEAMLCRARRSSIHMVILFIDEAQELENLHYQWLRNISNEMDMAGYRLFCLLVGQHDLQNKRDSLMIDDMEQIVGRFMTEAWAFSGLKTAEDVKSVLDGYDGAVYPTTSNRPFIDYFAPQACANGWRLANLKDMVWNEFEQQWSRLLIDRPLEVGMQYMTSTVAALLNLASMRDKEDLILDAKDVKTCVGQSGFVNAMKILNNFQQNPKKKRAVSR